MKKTEYLAIIVLLISACLSSCASGKVEFTVPRTGSYYCWFTYAGAKGDQSFTLPVKYKGTKIFMDLPVVNKTLPTQCVLYVLDSKSGNEAIQTIADNVSQFDLKPFDFRYVRLVKIKVEKEKSLAPIAAATVELKDFEQKTQVQVLDPTAMGKALFYNVAAGPAWITVEYGDGKKIDQYADIPAIRDKAAHIETVQISGKIDTVKSSYDPDTGDETRHRKPNYILVLLILLVAGMGIYMLIKNIGNHSKEVHAMLKTHGIDLDEESSETKLESIK